MAMTGQREASTQQDINQVKIYVKHPLELKKKKLRLISKEKAFYKYKLLRVA